MSRFQKALDFVAPKVDEAESGEFVKAFPIWMLSLFAFLATSGLTCGVYGPDVFHEDETFGYINYVCMCWITAMPVPTYYFIKQTRNLASVIRSKV